MANPFSKLFKRGKSKSASGKKNASEKLPLRMDGAKHSIPYIDILSDADLVEANKLLDWKCFILDSEGRRFGDKAWAGKRTDAETLSERRHQTLNERVPLAGKHVLEIGCFEGIHTISLCNLAKRVTAIDSRMENVFKTIIRCAMFGHHPTVFKADVEDWASQLDMLQSDVCHHIGVLYHLKDPVSHLRDLTKITREAIFLDTHYALDMEAGENYEVDGQTYAYKKYQEGKDVFSGMYDHAKWLTLQTLRDILTKNGFSDIEVIEKRDERNGPRLLLLAKKA